MIFIQYVTSNDSTQWVTNNDSTQWVTNDKQWLWTGLESHANKMIVLQQSRPPVSVSLTKVTVAHFSPQLTTESLDTG